VKEYLIQMKHSLALVIMLASGIALSAAAQTLPSPAASSAPAAPAGPEKIAVIAFQVAVAQTNEGQRNFADLQKKYDPKRQQLKAMSEELETLTKQLQTQGDSLSDTERASRARTIDEKKKTFDRDAADAKNDFQGAMQEMMSGLASKVYDVLANYAQQQGYSLVLDESQQQGPVLIASPTTDITRTIIEAYNVKSGVPAQPRPDASTTRPPAPHTAAPAAAH
jgi:outer membrane protein